MLHEICLRTTQLHRNQQSTWSEQIINSDFDLDSDCKGIFSRTPVHLNIKHCGTQIIKILILSLLMIKEFFLFKGNDSCQKNISSETVCFSGEPEWCDFPGSENMFPKRTTKVQRAQL